MTNAPKVLVVYYSMSGHTRSLAEAIARECDGTLAEIEDVASRKGAFGYLRCALDVALRREPPIRYRGPQLSQFDVVAIGAPVWMSAMAPPVRSFVKQHRDELSAVGVYCSYGGSGADKAIAGLTPVFARAPRATLSVKEAEFASASCASAVKAFVEQIRAV